jgi:hypothetical protein
MPLSIAGAGNQGKCAKKQLGFIATYAINVIYMGRNVITIYEIGNYGLYHRPFIIRHILHVYNQYIADAMLDTFYSIDICYKV